MSSNFICQLYLKKAEIKQKEIESFLCSGGSISPFMNREKAFGCSSVHNRFVLGIEMINQ